MAGAYRFLIHLSVTGETKKALAKLARQRDKTIAATARAAIIDYLDRQAASPATE